MNFFQQLFSSKKEDIAAFISEGALLVDVRTPSEYASGHIKGSVNIPVDTIPQKLTAFKNQKHIIVYCRSGNRSAMAKNILQQNGFNNVVNGGTWTHVNQFVQ